MILNFILCLLLIGLSYVLYRKNEKVNDLKRHADNLAWEIEQWRKDLDNVFKQKNVLQNEIIELRVKMPEMIKKERGDAVQRSAAVLKGKINEEICPILKDFPYHMGDLRFSGNPIDFYIYKGYSNNKIDEIIFLEIKTGDSALNERQKQIKQVIEKGDIKFEIFRI